MKLKKVIALFVFSFALMLINSCTIEVYNYGTCKCMNGKKKVCKFKKATKCDAKSDTICIKSMK